VRSRQVGEDDGKSEMSSTRDGTDGGGVDQNLGHNHTEDLSSYGAGVMTRKAPIALDFKNV